MLKAGTKAPVFKAESTRGFIDLEEYIGKQPVVLIFYPKNDSMICTKQLCAVRDSKLQYELFNALVQSYQVGIQFLSFLGQHRMVFVIDLSGNVIYAKKGNRPTAEIIEVLQR